MFCVNIAGQRRAIGESTGSFQGDRARTAKGVKHNVILGWFRD